MSIATIRGDVTGMRAGDHVVACLSGFCGTCPQCLSGHPNVCTGGIVATVAGVVQDRLLSCWRGHVDRLTGSLQALLTDAVDVSSCSCVPERTILSKLQRPPG